MSSRVRLVLNWQGGTYVGGSALNQLAMLGYETGLLTSRDPLKLPAAIELYEKLAKKYQHVGLWVFREKRRTARKKSRYVWQLKKLGMKARNKKKSKVATPRYRFGGRTLTMGRAEQAMPPVAVTREVLAPQVAQPAENQAQNLAQLFNEDVYPRFRQWTIEQL